MPLLGREYPSGDFSRQFILTEIRRHDIRVILPYTKVNALDVVFMTFKELLLLIPNGMDSKQIPKNSINQVLNCVIRKETEK